MSWTLLRAAIVSVLRRCRITSKSRVNTKSARARWPAMILCSVPQHALDEGVGGLAAAVALLAVLERLETVAGDEDPAVDVAQQRDVGALDDEDLDPVERDRLGADAVGLVVDERLLDRARARAGHVDVGLEGLEVDLAVRPEPLGIGPALGVVGAGRQDEVVVLAQDAREAMPAAAQLLGQGGGRLGLARARLARDRENEPAGPPPPDVRQSAHRRWPPQPHGGDPLLPERRPSRRCSSIKTRFTRATDRSRVVSAATSRIRLDSPDMRFLLKPPCPHPQRASFDVAVVCVLLSFQYDPPGACREIDNRPCSTKSGNWADCLEMCLTIEVERNRVDPSRSPRCRPSPRTCGLSTSGSPGRSRGICRGRERGKNLDASGGGLAKRALEQPQTKPRGFRRASRDR